MEHADAKQKAALNPQGGTLAVLDAGSKAWTGDIQARHVKQQWKAPRRGKHQIGSPDKKLKTAAEFGEETYTVFKQVNTSQQAPCTINTQQVAFDDKPVQEQNDQQSVFERLHKAYMTNVKRQEATHTQRMESVFQRMGKHCN